MQRRRDRLEKPGASAFPESAPPESLIRSVINNKHSIIVRRADNPQDSHEVDASAGSCLAVPVMREQTCWGIISLDSPVPDHFNSAHQELIEVAARVALLLCERKDALQLLQALGCPVDYNRSFDDFLDNLILIAALASGMPLLVLRELVDDDALRCIKTYGFSHIIYEGLDLAPITDYPAFHEVVTQGKPYVGRRLEEPGVDLCMQTLGSKTIGSYVVVPVSVGNHVFGTLSFAVAWTHEYTDFQILGLESIASMIGVAISNYRATHAAAEHLFNQARTNAAITSLELYQSVRHEAMNLIDDMQMRFAPIQAMARHPSLHDLKKIGSQVTEMRDSLNDLAKTLHKLKGIQKPPDRETKLVRVEALWEDAFGLVTGRLVSLAIRVAIQGGALVNAAPDFLRLAFLNLILNSIDAFKEVNKKQNRTIIVMIDPQGDKSRDVLIRYTDNATGIDPTRLRSASGEYCSPAEIFNPGVSSKRDGSGYGLFLVRRILTEHAGSIDLLDHRNGVVFQIKLRKR